MTLDLVRAIRGMIQDELAGVSCYPLERNWRLPDVFQRD
ncbi:hypothetical protein SAMN05216233_10952 [Desulfoluna spongiiphila]|uniref:Uncharacterized protein n=1 Tax=Desulfoluna spongiiphila TaxID=419481 RepID=A0A1G5FWU8_9BACT|nr:hypothetical protein SAMN05216233_10952 [Desulfoluna spongiiphila]